MAKKKYSPEAYERQHLRNQYARAQAIMKAYEDAMAEASRIVASGVVDPNKAFNFDDYPSIKKQIDELMQEVNDYMLDIIQSGNQEEWNLANAKNDAMVDSLIASTSIPKSTMAEWKHPNLTALSAFQGRKIEGMKLSKRVWNLTDQFRQELELALDLGIGEGKSADKMSRDVRRYLLNPDKLFRRVRDKHGNLRLSKATKAYHPGRGVYRSSYRNALRLTATENNMAYRTADHLRHQQQPFVLGIEIKLSNNHTCKGIIGRYVDICDDLVGVYPKDFKFVGWHPNCRCYVVAKQCTQKEMVEYLEKLGNGEDVSNYKFNGEVKQLPSNFTNWYENNQERIARAKSMPYFLRDNQKLIEKTTQRINKSDKDIFSLEEALKGWKVTNSDKYNNGIANKIAWGELHDDLVNATSTYGIELNTFSMNLGDKYAEFAVIGDSFRMTRRIELVNGTIIAKHKLFTLDERYQGKGISKITFHALYKQYLNSNVTRIEVVANKEVGGYAWARYGFYATDKITALRGVTSEDAKNFILDYYKAHNLKDNTPFPMRLITENFDGLYEMSDLSWDGVLDFKNKTSREYFEKYIGFNVPAIH